MKRPPTPERLGVLTGADLATLAAVDACWQSLPYVDHRENVVAAVRALLPNMQEKCWPLARELIARALDWDDRDRLWREVQPGVEPESLGLEPRRPGEENVRFLPHFAPRRTP